MNAPDQNQEATGRSTDIVLYMLHCGLKGQLLQQVCRREGVRVQVRQFPREQQFAYHMHAKRAKPDMVLIRGHFIGLFHDLDKDRQIPYLVVSSKEKYGAGQPVFIHAEKGYDPQETLEIYREIARAIKQMLQSGGPEP